MYFLACTHESMWSQQPLTNPNGDPQSWPPEDFVVSESIQQRHAWVYLNASIWAEWSGGQPSGGMAQTYGRPKVPVNVGGLFDHVGCLGPT